MLLASVLFLSLALQASGFIFNTDVVTLTDGTQLKGKREGNVIAFRGIPYAEAPVGNLRWAPPVSWTNPHFDKTIDASRFGSQCMQEDGGGSEDCLFINVFVNVNSNLTDAPVGVFIHGGSYTGNLN